MHELGLLVGVIVVTLLVMTGLVLIFRRWLARREDLIRLGWSETGGAEPKKAPVKGSPGKEQPSAAGGVAA